MLQDEFVFVHNDSVRESGSWFSIRIRVREVFAEYKMIGYSDAHAEIVVEINVTDLARIMRLARESVRMKLTSKEGEPHLRLQLRANIHNAITHDLPVTVIAPNAWADFDQPEISGSKIAAHLPSTRKLHRIVLSMKNMGAKYLRIRLNRNGRFVINGEMDMATASVFFGDLGSVPIPVIGGDKVEEVDVRLELRFVYALLANLQMNFAPIELGLVNERLAVFTIDQSDAKLLYVVGALMCA